MIFTLLYSSSLLKENEHRNIYLYALGMVVYTVIHWLIFSSIGDKYELVQKYRYVLYAIAAGDMLFVSNKYKEFSKKANSTRHQQHHSPNIEEVNDPPESLVTNNPSQQTQQSSVCHKQICQAPPKEKEQKETTSVASLPVYVPQHVVSQVTDNIKEIPHDTDLPVYTSHQQNVDNIAAKNQNTDTKRDGISSDNNADKQVVDS